MTKRLIIFLTILPLLVTATFASKDDKVVKVIIVRGTVTATPASGASFKISKGTWLKEGTALESSDRSFVKLYFIDKSEMSLGPNSKLVITTFPKKNSGIITLMKGQLRSKVSKDYMGIKNKNKSKLFIKTKTAAMGVRGTHFQVNYNPMNEVTSLVTFEGSVAMAQINANILKPNQAALERIVSGDQAVLVKRGQYSGSNPKQLRVASPVKINPAQLKVLENNEGEIITVPNQSSNNKAKKIKKAKKNYRSAIPPGVDAKDFSNDTATLDQTMESQVGRTETLQAIKDAKVIKEETKTAYAVQGSVNYITGEVAPTAGGYVDTKTGFYIPPPEGSVYDKQTETFIPPPNYGGFDAETGEYTNENYSLTPEGRFVAIPSDMTDRSPASEEEMINNTQNNPPPPADLEIKFAACLTQDCSLPPPPSDDLAGPPPGPTPPPIQELSCEQLGTCPPLPNGSGRNVEFIFN